MPLHMRIPKLKGFKNPNKVDFQVVNVATINKLFPEEIQRANAQAEIFDKRARYNNLYVATERMSQKLSKLEQQQLALDELGADLSGTDKVRGRGAGRGSVYVCIRRPDAVPVVADAS